MRVRFLPPLQNLNPFQTAFGRGARPVSAICVDGTNPAGRYVGEANFFRAAGSARESVI